MIKVEYPKHNFRLKKEDNKEFIFDEIRKVWISLTPEEWVRQNFLQWLMQVKQYPASLISVEKEIKVNGLRKRYDIVVYKEAMPWMIVECKEMGVQLSESVITQVVTYNSNLSVGYLVITNGTSTFAFETSSAQWLQTFPDFAVQ